MPLNKLKQLFVPNDGNFFELMQKQAEIACASSAILCDMLVDHTDLKVKTNKIRLLEHEGDQLMREIYTSLNNTFIVPIDHGDISSLASGLDDIIDLIDHISTLFVIYKLDQPSPPMVQLSKIVMEQATELKSAVAALNHSRTYGQVAKHCNKIKSLENKADEIYLRAIEELFDQNDPILIIKQKELLECLESTTDKIDKVAQHISDIMMRHS
ncbi:DUF47 family protein [Candidatus Micrarchaeota archaeon]|nr:DUF47 family protein [Candidatus Micrarchaeota archaeon]